MEVLYHIRPYFVPEMAIECSSVHPPQKIPFKSVDRSPSFFFFSGPLGSQLQAYPTWKKNRYAMENQ